MQANDKIHETAIEMRSPKDDAGGPELALATLVQGLSSPQARQWLADAQEAGELDPFLGTLATWLVAHRSDTEPVLALVELPRDEDAFLALTMEEVADRVKDARAVALGPPPTLS